MVCEKCHLGVSFYLGRGCQFPFIREAFGPQCSPRPSLLMLKVEVRKNTGVVALNLPRGPGFVVSLDSSLDSTCVVGCMRGVFSGFPRWGYLRCNKGGLVSVGYR